MIRWLKRFLEKSANTKDEFGYLLVPEYMRQLYSELKKRHPHMIIMLRLDCLGRWIISVNSAVITVHNTLWIHHLPSGGSRRPSNDGKDFYVNEDEGEYLKHGLYITYDSMMKIVQKFADENRTPTYIELRGASQARLLLMGMEVPPAPRKGESEAEYNKRAAAWYEEQIRERQRQFALIGIAAIMLAISMVLSTLHIVLT